MKGRCETSQNDNLCNKNSISRFDATFKAILLCVVMGRAPVALSGPYGGSVVAGQAQISQSGLNTSINQSSNRVAIDWQSFNINTDESVAFTQPDSSSIALNRILDQNPTQIFGSITANGQIVLVNPRGIFFGDTATVNVGSLFVSALDISPEDFMAGRLDFHALENTSGLIVNQGTLKVIDGGTLALLGQQVRNEGLLVANFGTVALASGSDIQVRFDAYNQLSIRINQNRLADILDIDDPAIFNSGLIEAHGGRVVLTARQVEAIQNSIYAIDESDRFSSQDGMVVVADGGYYLTGPDGDISDLGHVDVSTDQGQAGTVIYAGGSVNHQGELNADAREGEGGKVLLDATDTVMLRGDSRISAQALESGVGGQVHLLGEQVGLIDKAEVNVSGVNGGGEVLVGGDYLGSNPDIKNARAVYMGIDTRIHADAVQNGDGGKIVLWSNSVTRAYGQLTAVGGLIRGDGGLIETSSAHDVFLAPVIDVHASNGRHGEWLIDPAFIQITLNELPDDIDLSDTSDLFSTDLDQDSESILSILTLESSLRSGANVIVRTQAHTTEQVNPVICGDALPCIDDHYTESQTVDIVANGISYDQYHHGDIVLFSNLDFDNAGTNRDGSDNASTLTLQAHRDVVIEGDVFDSDGNNGIGNPDGDILNLTLTANYQGTGVQTGDATQGSVVVNGNIDLQGGDLTISGIDFTQDANSRISTEITQFDPVTEFGGPNPSLPNGDLIVNVTGSVDAAGELNIVGATNITATGDVSLSNNNNLLAGDVTVAHQSTGSTLGNINIHNDTNLTVNLNDAVTSVGVTTTAGNDATINSNSASTLNLGNSFVRGNLTVNAAADIAQQALTSVQVNNQTTFNMRDGRNLDLRNLGNDFGGTVLVQIDPLNTTGPTDRVQNIQLYSANSLTVADVLIDGLLDIESGDDLIFNNITIDDDTQSLRLASGNVLSQNATGTTGLVRTGTGTNAFSATAGDIQLTDNAHNVNQASFNTGADVLFNNGTNALQINELIAANADITATGGITDVPGGVTFSNVTGDTVLNAAAANISLTHTSNDFNNLIVTGGTVTVVDTDSINLAGNMASLDVTAGQGGATSTISNVTDQSINVTGTTDLTLSNGGDINLDNGFTGANANNLQGTISLTSGTGSLTSINLRNLGNIQLAGFNADGGSIDLQTAGNITQTGAWRNVGGDTRLAATDITLGQANDFNQLVIENASNVTINELNSLAVTGSNTNASNSINLDLTAAGDVVLDGEFNNLNVTTVGDIADAGSTLTVANLTQLDAGNNDVILQNGTINLNELVLANVTQADIVNQNAILIGGHVQAINLQTQAGAIRNNTTALIVDTTAQFDAANGTDDVFLDLATNDFNQIQVNARSAILGDANAIDLGDIDTTQNLSLLTGGNITQQAGSRIVSQDVSVNAINGAIDLTQTGNQFNRISLSADSAQVVNSQALIVGTSNLVTDLSITTLNGSLSIDDLSAGDTITLNAADAIVNNNGTATNLQTQRAVLRAANGVGMSGGNLVTRVSRLDAHNTSSGDINIDNTNNIVLESIINDATDTGNFNLRTDQDIQVGYIQLVQNLSDDFTAGTVDMFTRTGDVLGTGPLDRSQADITASNLRVTGGRGTFGTLQRPLVLDISGRVELRMRATLNPVFLDPQPVDVVIDGLQFDAAETLSAVNGVQVTEVETLLDISPAIFTDVRHFVVAEYPVKLPRDQLYIDGFDQEDDEDYFRRFQEGEPVEQVQ